MFNNENDKAKILISMTLTNGRCLKGNLLVVPSSTLSRTLNNDSQFLEFEDLEGNLHMMAKTAIAEVVGTALPKGAKLEIKALDERNTPHSVLGVPPNATASEIDAAIASMRRVYDPSTYAGAPLPDEVARYLEAKLNSLNAAYGFLNGEADPKAA